MEKAATVLGGVILIAGAILFAAFIGGTVLWAIYPHIHALFPTAAAKGIIAYKLGWWDSVCITYIFGILIKSSQTNNNKEK